MSDEVDFLHALKHESLLQTDSMWIVKNFQSSQHSKFAMSLQYLKKEVSDEVDFLHADNFKVSYKLISTLSDSKFRTV